jgi:transposase-like protein
LDQENPFKWRHYQPEIILLCVRWYLRYSLSYRDLEEMMVERGLSLDHTTIYRWIQHYAPQLEQRVRAQLKQTNDSWRVDETYIKIRGTWIYLYRAVEVSATPWSSCSALTATLNLRNASSAKR